MSASYSDTPEPGRRASHAASGSAGHGTHSGGRAAGHDGDRGNDQPPPHPGGRSVHPPSGRWTSPELGVVAIAVALLFLLTFPVYSVANHVYPLILGMPVSMFWMVAWIAVEFVALLAIYAWEHGRRRG